MTTILEAYENLFEYYNDVYQITVEDVPEGLDKFIGSGIDAIEIDEGLLTHEQRNPTGKDNTHFFRDK